MKNLLVQKMKQAGFVLMMGMAFISCEKNPITLVLHNPIYPTGSQAVTYNAERVTDGSISDAKLYETVNTINNSGSITSTGTETLLQTWNSPSGDLSFTKPSGHGDNKLVTYRWVFTTPDQTKTFKVTYATRPYPVANIPAPVYVQGDPDDVFDLVFIPDTDVTSMNTFYTNCRGAIREAFFEEPHTQFWRRQYNFYINKEKGHATDYDHTETDGYHVAPSNNAYLSFAEGKVIMHQLDLRDYRMGSLFSTEMQNRGTIMHESGHAFYSLADEYSGGVHWQEEVLPNNWTTLAGAQAASTGYGSCKQSSDAVQIDDSGYHRLCVSNCQMGHYVSQTRPTGYDCPGQSRITYVVFDNASN
ncbi:hypothetical protein Aeqsu_1643 [Aequorivita sublithincola DSM 14238]|uniref:Uncharacterized protein n=1 Tax=Aequorivita sublithincola (strain DSM 14238 / LMG 21431 / ACAM 643 / 9-3) TaxID=746697 RepID=I3YVV9_AEQSU|nr:hypothetical protein [Aequorivita sublithincola]AFL81127.1 hypothetical protein Aeqsu_1643 [Aequorivita sublithincola DSM 14238]